MMQVFISPTGESYSAKQSHVSQTTLDANTAVSLIDFKCRYAARLLNTASKLPFNYMCHCQR